MTPTEQSPVMGLDIGTSHIVAGKSFESTFQYERQLNAFVTIPFTKMAQGLLNKERIPHAVQGEEILIFGNDAEQFAELFHVEARRPMMRGLLNAGEADGMLVDPADHYAPAGPCPQAGADALFQRAGAGVWRERRQIHVSRDHAAGSAARAGLRTEEHQ
jgi:hypothetical protein